MRCPSRPRPARPSWPTRLAARTLELIDVPSESRDEAALAAHVAGVLRDGGAVVEDLGDSCVLAYPRETQPAGAARRAIWTRCPAQDNIPGRIAASRVHGLGASDMKGALAVMIELVLARVPYAALFFPREELPSTESALTPLLERSPVERRVRGRDGADRRRAARGLPRQHQRDLDVPRALRALRAAVAGRQRDPPARRSASPRWRPRRRCRSSFDGLTFHEVASVTRVEGGIAMNVIPESCTAHVNFRYAPGPHAARRPRSGCGR